jgi:hypothetical protein
VPNAAFIGFTGTPLFKQDEITKRIFGNYVSRYDFKRSEEGGATVKRVYENRGEKLGVVRLDLNSRIAEKIEAAELDLRHHPTSRPDETGFRCTPAHPFRRRDRLRPVADGLRLGQVVYRAECGWLINGAVGLPTDEWPAKAAGSSSVTPRQNVPIGYADHGEAFRP